MMKTPISPKLLWLGALALLSQTDHAAKAKSVDTADNDAVVLHRDLYEGRMRKIDRRVSRINQSLSRVNIADSFSQLLLF